MLTEDFAVLPAPQFALDSSTEALERSEAAEGVESQSGILEGVRDGTALPFDAAVFLQEPQAIEGWRDCSGGDIWQP